MADIHDLRRFHTDLRRADQYLRRINRRTSGGAMEANPKLKEIYTTLGFVTERALQAYGKAIYDVIGLIYEEKRK